MLCLFHLGSMGPSTKVCFHGIVSKYPSFITVTTRFRGLERLVAIWATMLFACFSFLLEDFLSDSSQSLSPRMEHPGESVMATRSGSPMAAAVGGEGRLSEDWKSRGVSGSLVTPGCCFLRENPKSWRCRFRRRCRSPEQDLFVFPAWGGVLGRHASSIYWPVGRHYWGFQTMLGHSRLERSGGYYLSALG